MSNQTKLPWKIMWSHKKGIAIGTEKGPFLDVLDVDIGFEEAQRIAEYIVLAVNAHKKLLDACECARNRLEELENNGFESGYVDAKGQITTLEHLEAAIAAATP